MRLLVCLAFLAPLWAATPEVARACSVSGPALAIPMCGEVSGYDTGDGGYLNGSLFLAPPAGLAVSQLQVYVGDARPGDRFALAIYQDQGGSPGALVAHSAAGALASHAWNALPVVATLAPGEPYWLVYAASSADPAQDDMGWDPSSGTQAYGDGPVQFGTWPADFGPAAVGTGTFALIAQ